MACTVAVWACCMSPAVLTARTWLCGIQAYSLQHSPDFTGNLQTGQPQEKLVLSYCIAETEWRVYKSKIQGTARSGY